MKSFESGFIVLLMCTNAAYALDPHSGWYVGLLAGTSIAADNGFDIVIPLPNVNNPTLPIPVLNRRGIVTTAGAITGTATLSTSRLGDFGGQIGYRFENFRVEGEFLYNNNPFYQLKIGDYLIAQSASNVINSNTTVEQLLQQNDTSQALLQLSGSTNTYAFMVNGFYDFFLRDYTTRFVPYAGLGFGYAQRQSNIDFSYQGSTIYGASVSQSGQQFAGQAIGGISYYLTDYTSFSLDYRYLASAKSTSYNNTYSSMQSNPKLYSVNLLFNTGFNI